MSIERALMYLFLVAVAGYGMFGLIAPHRLVQPKGDWWFFDYMTGRICYTSARRARVTCGLLFVVAALGLVLALTGSEQ